MEFKRAVWLKWNEWREKQEMGPSTKRSRNQAE